MTLAPPALAGSSAGRGSLPAKRPRPSSSCGEPDATELHQPDENALRSRPTTPVHQYRGSGALSPVSPDRSKSQLVLTTPSAPLRKPVWALRASEDECFFNLDADCDHYMKPRQFRRVSSFFGNEEHHCSQPPDGRTAHFPLHLSATRCSLSQPLKQVHGLFQPSVEPGVTRTSSRCTWSEDSKQDERGGRPTSSEGPDCFTPPAVHRSRSRISLLEVEMVEQDALSHFCMPEGRGDMFCEMGL